MVSAHITINGVQFTANAAATILQICTLVGIYIPRFCYHEKLSIVGSCRMCLVELHKSFKPLVACATPLLTGMNIRTETALIKNSREHILEFLLINHPLDCPICDQGGECDLQDQALIYGSDRGRFKEKKRAVANKNFGPFIKTMMTRCIHCTRCVRFMSEIALDHVLGTLGRGKDMEIGTYINKSINSEISGNIIDICPVGALTSKPFAFSTRSWELRSVESVDIFDGLGSSVRLDFRGSEIVRILPKTNESINEQWITNKIRFTYDGFKYQRLLTPMVRKYKWCVANSKLECSFVNLSWERATRLLSMTVLYHLLVYGNNGMAFTIGKLIDITSIYLLIKVVDFLGLPNVISRINILNNDTIDFRESYILNKPIAHFEKSGAYIFIGSNLQTDAPLLNTRLFKKTRHKKLVGFFGSFLKNIALGKQLGIHTMNLIRIIEGRHSFCRIISSLRNICWVTNGQYTHDLFHILCALPRISAGTHYFSMLHDDCTRTSMLDLGFSKMHEKIADYTYNNNHALCYNIGNEKYSTYSPCSYVVYQGHHNISNNVDNSRIHMFLPSTTFIEKTQFHVSTEGRLLSTRKAVSAPGLAKDDIDIVSIFGILFGFNIPKDTNYISLRLLIPHLFLNLKWRLHSLYFFVWYLFCMQLTATIHGTNIYNAYSIVYINSIDNYYSTNVITAASKIVAKCTELFSNYSYYY